MNRLEELIRWGWEKRIIVLDRDGLWQRLGGDTIAAQYNYSIHSIQDEMALRYLYESKYRTSDEPCLIRISEAAINVPFDIGMRFSIVNLSLENAFPQLSSEVPRSLPDLDLEHLTYALEHYIGPKMDNANTLTFCTKQIYDWEYAHHYFEALMKRCLAAADGHPGFLDWTRIAAWYGKALMLTRDSPLDSISIAQAESLQTSFTKWMESEYRKLSAEVHMEQPVLLSGTADFLRRQGGKTALVVLDGMSFENLFLMKRSLMGNGISMDIRGTFSFLPSVTVIARQCLFAGQLPVELSNLSSLSQEEKQWRTFWKNTGLRDEEICFAKTDILEVDDRWKAVGLVISIIDDLMHSQLQGMDGMARDLEAWVRTGRLKVLLTDLVDAGFDVFLTSDHGNTAAVAQGRFKNPGILAEPASKRAVIYQSFADARELDDFSVSKYDGTYLPEGSNAWLFAPGACYGDKGKEYITHGGMTIEEVIVPFVKIGV